MSNIKEMKKDLLKLILKNSFRYDPEYGFTLASGRKSDIYIDLKKTTTTPGGALLIGKIITNMIAGLPVTGVGGLTLGADPIAYAVMMASAIRAVEEKERKPVNAFVIRKTVKAHGTRNMVEGAVEAGDNVIIIDDVVTTGGSTIEAIDKAAAAGLNILGVVSVVDREEGGREAIESHINNRVKEYRSIFTRADLVS